MAQHIRTCILLASLARLLRFALTKKFLKKSVSQSTQNALKRIEMQNFFYPFDPYILRALNVAQILFDQNPTHSKRDISRKSGTDRQTHTHR